MEIVWSYGKHGIDGFDELLEQYRAVEFESPRRSTIPLLAYWREPQVRVAEFLGELGAAPGDEVRLSFEHDVPVQQGRGKASFTDLMIETGGISVAVEGKYTESRYESVGIWLSKSTSRNRSDVLSGWLGLLGECAGHVPSVDSVSGLPYQLIHRAAAACYLDVDVHWLVYQIFDSIPEKMDMYLNDLRGLAEVLGSASELHMGLVGCSIESSDRYDELVARWESERRTARTPVMDGLRAGHLLSVAVNQVIAV